MSEITTPADFLQDVRDLVSTALFGIPGQGSMVSDYSPGVSDSFVAGETKYQCRIWIAGQDERSGSNNVYLDMGVQCEVFHALSSRTAEPSYTSGDMLSQQSALLNLDSWRRIPGVYDLAENPVIDSVPQLTGNILNFRCELISQIVTN